MAVSRILYYKTVQQNALKSEYILIQKREELSFFGREWESGKLSYTIRLSELPHRTRYLKIFLDRCVESDTSPRMVEELMEDYFSCGWIKKEKTDV